MQSVDTTTTATTTSKATTSAAAHGKQHAKLSADDAVAAAAATTTTTSTATKQTAEVAKDCAAVKSKKARSRFTSALRKLSKTRKRDKVAPKEAGPSPPQNNDKSSVEAPLSSSDAQSSPQRAAAATAATPTTITNAAKPKGKSKLTRRLLGSLRSKSKDSSAQSSFEQGATWVAHVATADALPPDDEQQPTAATAVEGSAKLASESPKNDDGDYLTPSSVVPAAAATTSAEKKKLKKRASSSSQPTVTRSDRDTPPRERAPARPATTRVTVITTQRSLWSSLRGGSSAEAAQQPMQYSANAAQRGYRFPKPQPSNATPSVATVESQQQSHAIQTSATPPPSPPSSPASPLSTTTTTGTPPTALPQLNSDQAPSSALPPIPPSVSPYAATPETRSLSARQRQPLGIAAEANVQNSLHISPVASVADAYSSGADNDNDDAISTAESAQPSEDYTTRAAAQDLSSSANAIRIDQSPVRRFVIGGVGPHSIETLREQISVDQEESSLRSSGESLGSPQSEQTRRRIRYVAQSTLHDSFNSFERRCVALRMQSGFSGASYESDDDAEDMPAFGDLTMDQEMEPTILTAGSNEQREHLYKILVIGELGTGKTSFIKRYVHQFFSQNYRATIGVDFALKVLHWDAGTIVRLQLWDIAGQERFGNMTRVYYKEAVGAFIVFDVTRSGTFDCVTKWKEDLDSKVQLPDGSPIPCILLANKCDQEKQGLVTTPEKMDEYVRENGFAGWFETSAKENINIDEASRALVSKILLNDKLISAADLADSEKFNLKTAGDAANTETKTKCSC